MRAKMAAAHKGANIAVGNSRKRAEDVTQLVLTSRVKTAGSPVFQQGFPVGYAVNGVETPTIDVVAGRVSSVLCVVCVCVCVLFVCLFVFATSYV